MKEEFLEKAFEIAKNDFVDMINEMGIKEFERYFNSESSTLHLHLTMCKEDLKANTSISLR